MASDPRNIFYESLSLSLTSSLYLSFSLSVSVSLLGRGAWQSHGATHGNSWSSVEEKKFLVEMTSIKLHTVHELPLLSSPDYLSEQESILN